MQHVQQAGAAGAAAGVVSKAYSRKCGGVCFVVILFAHIGREKCTHPLSHASVGRNIYFWSSSELRAVHISHFAPFAYHGAGAGADNSEWLPAKVLFAGRNGFRSTTF